jgi:hypothetical protein
MELAASVRLTSGHEPAKLANPSDFNSVRRAKNIDPPFNPFLFYKKSAQSSFARHPTFQAALLKRKTASFL